MTTIRERLLAERSRAQQRAAALDLEFAGIAEAASEPGTDDEHDPEGATLAFERQHTAALYAQALDQIAGIDAAIGRLDSGTYGRCVRCGQPIAEDRLTARPTAATCIHCARLGAARPQRWAIDSAAAPAVGHRWAGAARAGGRRGPKIELVL